MSFTDLKIEDNHSLKNRQKQKGIDRRDIKGLKVHKASKPSGKKNSARERPCSLQPINIMVIIGLLVNARFVLLSE